MQESGKRSHYSNYETLLRRHFSKNAFFFTPEAVGFFYQPNTLGIFSDKPFVYLLPRGTLRERELFEKYNLLSEKHLDSGGGMRIMGCIRTRAAAAVLRSGKG